jgi:tRNA-specific 2-thiouridylase
MKKRVIVGLSGGIDSSMAAYLLKENGYEVIGLYLDLNAGNDKQKIKTVKDIAKYLGIDLKIKNLANLFKQRIIDNYINSYLKALTPNPCIRCNRFIKFKALYEQMLKLKAHYVATGHYARITREKPNGNCYLSKAEDESKDQSYFLYQLSSRQLLKVLFPLGRLTKKEVRAKAKKNGLDKFPKKESQEICFIPDKKQSEYFISKYNVKPEKGEIINIKGEKIGEHKGFMFYTIGQRKGLGVAHKEPLYVIRIDAKNNIIVAGCKKDLYRKAFKVSKVTFSQGKAPAKEFKANVKIRYRHKESEALISQLSKNIWQVEFIRAQRAITPGQSAVFYSGKNVIGGGIIKGVSNE